MLNKNIHIHHFTDVGHETYMVADRYYDGEQSSDNPTTEAEILPNAAPLNDNGNTLGLYYVVVCDNPNNRSIVCIQRCNAVADNKGNVAASFCFRFNSCIGYNINLNGAILDKLVHDGKTQLSDLDGNSQTFAYTDFNRMRNDVFAILSGWLDRKLKAEVERERSENAAIKAVRQLSSIASKGYGTKLKHTKAHTIYDFITSDDEWWCSLPKEKKHKIRTENS